MEVVSRHRLQLFAGRSHPVLAQEIAANLGVEVGPCELTDFPNGESGRALASPSEVGTFSSCRRTRRPTANR